MSTARHPTRRGGFGKERDRLRVAQVAARLIVEHGLADWALAKRKAARQLMLPDTTPMPSNDEIEVALAEHHALFGGEAHEENLRAMRAQALQWMDRSRSGSRCSSAVSRPDGRPSTATSVSSSWPTIRRRSRCSLPDTA
jgi:hypothetical protein